MLDHAVFLRDAELLIQCRKKARSWALSHIIFVISTIFLLFPMLYNEYKRYIELLNNEEPIPTDTEVYRYGSIPDFEQNIFSDRQLSSQEIYVQIIFCKI